MVQRVLKPFVGNVELKKLSRNIAFRSRDMAAFAIAQRFMLRDAFIKRVFGVAGKAVAAAFGVGRIDLLVARNTGKQNVMIAIFTKRVA